MGPHWGGINFCPHMAPQVTDSSDHWPIINDFHKNRKNNFRGNKIKIVYTLFSK